MKRTTMTMDEYEEGAMQTARTDNAQMALANWAMGVAGEAGEFVDECKKVLFHGKPRDTDRLISELGDVLWYVAVAAREIGSSLHEVAAANLTKLQMRHGPTFRPHDEQNR